VSVALLNAELAAEVGSLVEHHATIMAWEVCRNLAVESFSPELLSPQMKDLIDKGLAMPRASYLSSLQQVAVVGQKLAAQYPDVNAILTPAAPAIAPLAETGTGSPHMSRAWQAMGLPTVTLTGINDLTGVPLGLQLVGKVREDDAVLANAAWVNQLGQG
jgi:Asp-tRNA(Asn)/Glu-tRNA(Gln) amidotransferase A subunit family amidase